MLKVGPSWSSGRAWPSWSSGRAWDQREKSEIAEIIISRSQTRINFIHLVYVEDGGNKLVMSEKLGSGDGGTLYLNTITLDYPHEVITGLTGKYGTDLHGYGSKRLRSITFVTNKCKYGPFEVSSADDKKDIEFEYDVGCKQFGGFFGTFVSDGIDSIGIYLKPLEKLTIIPTKKEEPESDTASMIYI